MTGYISRRSFFLLEQVRGSFLPAIPDSRSSNVAHQLGTMELSFPVHSQPTHSNQLTLSAELWSLLTQQLSSEGAEGGAGADPIPVAISARFGLGNRKGGKSLVVLAGRESQKLVNGVNGKHAKIVS